MAIRSTKEAAPAATARPGQAGAPPGAVETAIAAATTALLPAPPPREDALRRLAYSYYEERGRVDGHDLDDWLRAEAELGPDETGP